jgi:hypothetical protein
VGSIPITRSSTGLPADVAQLVEHVLGKDEVTGSIPVVSSSLAVSESIDFLLGAQRR